MSNHSHHYLFDISALSNTQSLARAYAPVLRAELNAVIPEQTNAEPDVYVALQGLPFSGKTTLVNSMIGELFDKVSDIGIELGPAHWSIKHLFSKKRYAWHDHHSPMSRLQVQRMDRVACIFSAMAKQKLSIGEPPTRKSDAKLLRFTEWAAPSDIRKSSTRIHTSQYAQTRTARMAVTPQISAMPEFQQFLEDAEPFMIK